MKKVRIAATAVLLAVMMTGCQNKEVKETESVPVESSVAETTKAIETTVSDADKEVKLFAEQIVKAVKKKDLDELIKLSAFPVYISSVETNKGVVESIEEFAEIEPGKIFTEDFIKAITAYDLTKLEKTEAGYVLGEETPNVIFKAKDGGFEITGINVN